ncbi:MAG: helix-hairpin-helix domain-containing protein [Oscillospiraceae bacterium]|nr:helix-hairpin-helix domain-containing protein [Oscillospiraceae bacterium]
MKLRRSELWAIAVTAVFLAAALGFQLGTRRSPPEFRVTAAATAAPERALPSAAPAEPDAAQPAEAAESGPVDINHATAEELKRLSGVGDALAARIVEYRTEHGPFQRLEDITLVSGIGPAVLEANRDRMVLGDGS